jgi:signal transduction histidine kinase
MEYLTNSLLDAATIEAGGLSMSRARCEVQDLLTATLEMFQPLAADKAIQLVVVTPDKALAVWTERERMLQVLSNLVSNALKFTAEGGTVTLRAEQVLAEVRFSVSDTGVGIAEDQRSRVFERYWKADTGGARRGAGLGLYIARGIVEAGRGRIWFETRLDRGSTFFFTSPSAAPEITQSLLQRSATSDGAPFRNGAGRGDATDTPR